MTFEKALKIHKYSIYNKQEIDESNLAGCFNCSSIFNPQTTIYDYIKELNGEYTVLCPVCEIDSVIDENSVKKYDEELTKELLNEMCEYFFKTIYNEDVV